MRKMGPLGLDEATAGGIGAADDITRQAWVVQVLI
jgi:hypothetical protein